MLAIKLYSSSGAILAISTALFALLLNQDWGIVYAGIFTLFCCICFGGINAICIVGFGAGPIATTLGMLTALRGKGFIGTFPDFIFDIITYELFLSAIAFRKFSFVSSPEHSITFLQPAPIATFF